MNSPQKRCTEKPCSITKTEQIQMLKKGYQSIQHLRIVPLFFILTKPRVYDGILKKTSKGVSQDESILIF